MRTLRLSPASYRAVLARLGEQWCSPDPLTERGPTLDDTLAVRLFPLHAGSRYLRGR